MSQQPLDDNNLADELTKLKTQLKDLEDVKTSCRNDAVKQHANDPIPVGVQFTINQEGDVPFQYTANSMGWSDDALVKKIYN